MVRKQILLDRELELELGRRSADLGISQGEFIRRTLRDSLTGPLARQREAKMALDALLEQHLATASPPEAVVGGDRGWTRDGLYADDDRSS